MPCGPALINAVASVLDDKGCTPAIIQKRLSGYHSLRAIRYAVAELIEQGRAKRKGQQGPVVAVRS